MNKLNTALFFLCSFFLCKIPDAQTVSFINQGSLLGTIPGDPLQDCAVDMNGDYLDDVVRVVNPKIYVDYQQPDGTFEHAELPITISNSPGWSICAGDIDNNGFNDLLFGGGTRVSFIYNNGGWTAYTEVVHPEFIFSQRTTFADIDNDGHLDAFVCHDTDQSHPYRNDGNGNLSLDQTLIETLDSPGNYAAIWVDYNNDGHTDLYVTKCRQGANPDDPARINRLYRNNGDGTYTEVGEEANLDDNAQSWSTVFEDFDNDGDFDAFIVNHDMQNRLMRNNGDGTFTDVIAGSGINANALGAWENASGDFNNDGYIDIFSELDYALYLGNGDLTFTPQTLPFNNGGIGDFNNDGFLDVIFNNNLMINNGNDNNWIKINTLGIQSNKNGIGARVEIHGDWGIQIREVRAGQSFSPMSSLTVHFGLGTSTSIDSIVIKWPSGIKTVFEDPSINTTYLIPESDCILGPSELIVDGPTTICPGEEVEISAPAGFAEYLWSNSMTTPTITVGEPGNYSVILTDSEGCVSLSNTVQVSFYSEFAPKVAVSGETTFCEGGSVTLSISEGANPMWSNGMTGLTVEITESGEYYVMTESVCTADDFVSDTIAVEVLPSPAPEVEDVLLPAPGPATLEVTSGVNLIWYDMPVGGDTIGMGSTFDFVNVETDTTVYVASNPLYGGEEQDGGKPDNSGPGGLSVSVGYSKFDAYEPFTLLRVTVYVPGGGTEGERHIQLVNEDEEVLDEVVVYLEVGTHEIELNFEVPTGTGLSLRCPEGNLFRNNEDVNYPYPIGDVGHLTTSVFGSTFYYYFYDWKIRKQFFECASERTAATVSVPTSTAELGDIVSGISIYPNPAGDHAYLQFEALESTTLLMRIFDVTGKEVLQRKEISSGSGIHVEEINTGTLAKGIYNVQLSVDGRSVSKKLVIQ